MARSSFIPTKAICIKVKHIVKFLSHAAHLARNSGQRKAVLRALQSLPVT